MVRGLFQSRGIRNWLMTSDLRLRAVLSRSRKALPPCNHSCLDLKDSRQALKRRAESALLFAVMASLLLAVGCSPVSEVSAPATETSAGSNSSQAPAADEGRSALPDSLDYPDMELKEISPPEMTVSTLIVKERPETGLPYSVDDVAGGNLLVYASGRPFVIDPARPADLILGPAPYPGHFFSLVDLGSDWLVWLQTVSRTEEAWRLAYSSLPLQDPIELRSAQSSQEAKPLLDLTGDNLVFTENTLEEGRRLVRAKVVYRNLRTGREWAVQGRDGPFFHPMVAGNTVWWFEILNLKEGTAVAHRADIAEGRQLESVSLRNAQPLLYSPTVHGESVAWVE